MFAGAGHCPDRSRALPEGAQNGEGACAWHHWIADRGTSDEDLLVRNRFKLHTHQLAAAAFTGLPRCSTAGHKPATPTRRGGLVLTAACWLTGVITRDTIPSSNPALVHFACKPRASS